MYYVMGETGSEGAYFILQCPGSLVTTVPGSPVGTYEPANAFANQL